MGLNVIRFCFSSQTPEKSVVELPLWFRATAGCPLFCANESKTDENATVIANTAVKLNAFLRNSKTPYGLNRFAAVPRTRLMYYFHCTGNRHVEHVGPRIDSEFRFGIRAKTNCDAPPLFWL